MGPSIMEPVVQNNRMAGRPQMLHGPEHSQPRAASASSSGAFQLMTIDAKHPVKRFKANVGRGISAQFPEYDSHELSPTEALYGSHDFVTATSFRQANVISQAPSGHAPGTDSETSTIIVSSELDESISLVSSGGSATTERPPLVAEVQLEDDQPIYSIGPIKVFNKIQRAIKSP